MRHPKNDSRSESTAATILLTGPEPGLAGRINGTGGDDVLHGTDDKDTLNGKGGDDQLFGMGGRDVLVGGGGADRLDGGAGIDVADYGGTQAISITFDKSGTSTVHVAGDADDTITSIERINGSDAGDTFDITAAHPKSIYGEGGDDLIYADPLKFDAKQIKIDGGDGSDILDLSHDSAPADYDPGYMLNFHLEATSHIEIVIGSRFSDDLLAANHGPNTVHGMDGNDYILADYSAPNFVFGDAGNDQLEVRWYQGEVHGGTGDDSVVFSFFKGADHIASPLLIDGGDGTDTVRYDDKMGVNSDTHITFVLGRDGADGTYALDDGTASVLRSIENVNQDRSPTYYGIEADIYCNEQANVIVGSVGDDLIAPNGKVAPRSNGDTTVDVVSGGAHADTFLITNVTAKHGNVIATDEITDFTQADGDKIDLSQVDARPRSAAIDNFHFIGSDAFTGHAGELRFEIADGVTMVMADTNGDTVADFALRLDGEITLTKADFVL